MIGEEDFFSGLKVDTSFYHRAKALLPVQMSILKLNFEISLNGYVYFPTSYLLKKVPNLGMHISVYVFLFLAFVVIAGRLPKKQDEKGEDTSKMMDFELPIINEFYINKNTGDIKRKKKIVSQLKKYRFKLFILLLESPDHYLDNETIKMQVWDDSNVTNEKINKIVLRLRKDLKEAEIPVSIENVRGHGYRITFS